MRIRCGIRWMLYLLLLAVNILLLGVYITINQKGGGIGDEIYRGVAIYYNEDKPKELLIYIIGLFLIFVLFLLYALTVMRTRHKKSFLAPLVRVADEMRFSRKNIINYFHFVVIPLCLQAFGLNNKAKVFIQFYIVIYGVFIIASKYDYGFLVTRIKGMFSKTIYPLLMLIVVSQVLLLFFDVIAGRLKVINEFYDIPESTMVSGKYVDNATYMSLHFGGFYEKRDVLSSGDKDNFVNILIPNNDPLMPALIDSLLYYNGCQKRLYLNRFVSPEVMGLYDYGELYKTNKRNAAVWELNPYSKKRYTKEEKKFLSNNKYEFHWQILERFMLHHHSFILAPISEYDAGVPINKIKAQYGIGNVIIFANMMKWFGGISYDNWLKISSLFYVIYYFLFALVLLKIFDNRILAVIIFLLSVALLNYHGYDFLILAPGDSPWRNFFDIAVLYLFYLYQKSSKEYMAHMALILGVISVIINPQIGLMIALAADMTYLVTMYLNNKLRYEKITVTVVYLAAALFLFKIGSTEGELAVYYLKGVIGFPLGMKNMMLLFAIIFIGYLAVIMLIKDRQISRFPVLLYLFFYAQALSVYYVWHADNNGLLTRSHIYLLAVIYMMSVVFSYNNRGWQHGAVLYKSFMFMAIVLYVLSSVIVFRGRERYNKIFIRHKAYQWEFDRAHFVSTMDPAFFKESVDLIKKYSGNDTGVYILSKYDYLLTFLAHKVSRMPFHDLKWYNMTEKEVGKTIGVVEKNDPTYLFVDRNICRNFNDDIVPSGYPAYGYLHDESVWRAQRQKLMSNIFEKISSNYRLVESGKLISVYKRIEI
jgi:hypothetical protein